MHKRSADVRHFASAHPYLQEAQQRLSRRRSASRSRGLQRRERVAAGTRGRSQLLRCRCHIRRQLLQMPVLAARRLATLLLQGFERCLIRLRAQVTTRTTRTMSDYYNTISSNTAPFCACE